MKRYFKIFSILLSMTLLFGIVGANSQVKAEVEEGNNEETQEVSNPANTEEEKEESNGEPSGNEPSNGEEVDTPAEEPADTPTEEVTEEPTTDGETIEPTNDEVAPEETNETNNEEATVEETPSEEATEPSDAEQNANDNQENSAKEKSVDAEKQLVSVKVLWKFPSELFPYDEIPLELVKRINDDYESDAVVDVITVKKSDGWDTTIDISKYNLSDNMQLYGSWDDAEYTHSAGIRPFSKDSTEVTLYVDRYVETHMTVVWDDNNNKENKRPDKIWFMTRDQFGYEEKPYYDEEDMLWWSNGPITKEFYGVKQSLTIPEYVFKPGSLDYVLSDFKVVVKPIDGYETTVTGNMRNGFIITNTLKSLIPNDNKDEDSSYIIDNSTDNNESKPTPKNNESKASPNTSDPYSNGLYLGLLMMSVSVMVGLLLIKRRYS